MDDEQKKELVANTVNSQRNLGINVAAFKKAGFIGAPLNGLNSFLSIPEENRKGDQLPGIPCKDSTNNELTYWMQVVKAAYAGEKMDLLLKGDNVAKYPAFKNVIAAFKKNELLKFQMVTNPENAPEGSELWKMSMQGIKQEN
jgi:hypothetical protein